MNISDIRRDYKLDSLDESNVAPDPVDQFSKWWNDALRSEIDEVNAMTLATSTKEGIPSARIVLLKGYDPNGFIFFTNYNSTKGKQIAENPQVALLFFWKELERQIRIQGGIEKLSAQASDEYFQSRPAGSRIGAVVSPQSEKIISRDYLQKKYLEIETQYQDGGIPRPEHWGGYIVQPHAVEFWQGRPSRLHDRLVYTKAGTEWKIERLAP